jgi:hypothetical protein
MTWTSPCRWPPIRRQKRSSARGKTAGRLTRCGSPRRRAGRLLPERAAWPWSITCSSARPAGRICRTARRSATPARPYASHRWRRCLTVLTGTGQPAAVSSAAFARHASAARTAATTPPARPGRNPPASGDHAPATTRTRHESPSWRSTTSPRGSAALPVACHRHGTTVWGFLPRGRGRPVASYGTTCLMPDTDASRSSDVGGSGIDGIPGGCRD